MDAVQESCVCPHFRREGVKEAGCFQPDVYALINVTHKLLRAKEPDAISNHGFINRLISLAIMFLASPYFLDIQNIGLSLYYNREKTTAHHDGKGRFTP